VGAVGNALDVTGLGTFSEAKFFPKSSADRKFPSIGIRGIDAGPPRNRDPATLFRAVRPERVLRDVENVVRRNPRGASGFVKSGLGKKEGGFGCRRPRRWRRWRELGDRLLGRRAERLRAPNAGQKERSEEGRAPTRPSALRLGFVFAIQR